MTALPYDVWYGGRIGSSQVSSSRKEFDQLTPTMKYLHASLEEEDGCDAKQTLDIQFEQIRSSHDDALPLLMTHGRRGRPSSP